MQKIDYNQLAETYDKRYVYSPLVGVAEALKEITSIGDYKTILEAGCGTGHWINQFSNNKRDLFGADLSLGMLKKGVKSGVYINLICADACALPFTENSFDLIICVNAVHFFDNKKEFILSGANLLKPGGLLAIISFNPRYPSTNWYLYKYFSGTRKLDLQRFPRFEKLKKWMREAGLIKIEQRLIHTVSEKRSGGEILTDHFLEKSAASQLAILSDKEYQTGLSLIKKDIDYKGEKIIFKTKLFFELIAGTKYLSVEFRSHN